jgi:hypothetical protein
VLLALFSFETNVAMLAEVLGTFGLAGTQLRLAAVGALELDQGT